MDPVPTKEGRLPVFLMILLRLNDMDSHDEYRNQT